MNASILTIGTEILQGNITDTNSQYFAQMLYDCDINVIHMSSVSDDKIQIISTLRQLGQISDLVIISGGLGPTQDDLTRECLSDFTGCELEFQQSIFEDISAKFKSFNLKMPDENSVQAYIPHGSRLINNKMGTAPGFQINFENTLYATFPGVPQELKSMFPVFLEALIKDSRHNSENKVFWIRTLVISESLLDQLLTPLCNTGLCSLGTMAHSGHVDLRFTYTGEEQKTISTILEYIRENDNQVYKRIYSHDIRQSIEKVLIEKMKSNDLKLALVESCTGGLITEHLTSVPGASEVLWGAWIAYADSFKQQQLDIDSTILKTHGAVSAITAWELVNTAHKKSQADICISVTGIAGPGGGSKDKPVGTVYIGLKTPDQQVVFHFKFRGRRDMIRERSMYTVFSVIWDYINKNSFSESVYSGLQEIIKEV